ncbi:hypothetical protein D3C81_1712180 [compost metagenome]
MQPRLGLADVRTALGQLGRQADRKLLLRRGQLPALKQLCLQTAWRLGRQQAERVYQVVAPGLQAR